MLWVSRAPCCSQTVVGYTGFSPDDAWQGQNYQLDMMLGLILTGACWQAPGDSLAAETVMEATSRHGPWLLLPDTARPGSPQLGTWEGGSSNLLLPVDRLPMSKSVYQVQECIWSILVSTNPCSKHLGLCLRFL